MSLYIRGIVAILVVVFVAGCYTAPASNPPPQGRVASQELPSGIKVIMLPARFSAVTAATEAPTAIPGLSEAVADEIMRDFARKTLAAKSVTVLDLDDLTVETKPRAVEAVEALRPEWGLLTSYFRDRAKLAPQFAKLREASGADAVWVCKVNAIVGAAAYWDSNSGAIAQSTSSTSIIIMLISLTDGKTLWANEVYARDVASGTKLRELNALIYSANKK